MTQRVWKKRSESLPEGVWYPRGCHYQNVWLAMDQAAMSPIEMPLKVVEGTYFAETEEFYVGIGAGHKQVTQSVVFWTEREREPIAPIVHDEKDSQLVAFNNSDKEVSLEIDNFPVLALASAFLPFFESKDSENYVGIDLNHPQMGKFTITMQLHGKVTPVEDLKAKQARIDDLESKVNLIDRKFISGNSCPVTRVVIARGEWGCTEKN